MRFLYVENRYNYNILNVDNVHIAQCNIMYVKPMVDRDEIEV